MTLPERKWKVILQFSLYFVLCIVLSVEQEGTPEIADDQGCLFLFYLARPFNELLHLRRSLNQRKQRSVTPHL